MGKIQQKLFIPVTKQTKKTFLVIVLIAIAGLIFAWVSADRRGDPESTDMGATQARNGQTNSVNSMACDTNAEFEGTSNPLADVGDEISDEVIALAQEEWKVSRGYLTEDTKYLMRESDGQLEALAEQGNTQALRILAGRHLSDDPPKMIDMLEEAVLEGDIPALLTAAGAWSNPYVHNTADSFHVSLNPATNTLALILTAQLRGDNVLAQQQLDQAFAEFNFDEQSVQEACLAARNLYEDLEAKRLERGYPPFDSSPSPYGRRFQSDGDYIAETCGPKSQLGRD